MRKAVDRRDGFNDASALQRDPASEKLDEGTPKQAAIDIKRVAKAFEAGLAATTKHDQRWEYVRKFSDQSLKERAPEIPTGLDHVIAVSQPMDYSWIRTVPSALSGAATGLGYSHDSLVVLSLAQYLRNLGCDSIASMNETFGCSICYQSWVWGIWASWAARSRPFSADHPRRRSTTSLLSSACVNGWSMGRSASAIGSPRTAIAPSASASVLTIRTIQRGGTGLGVGWRVPTCGESFCGWILRSALANA